MKRNSFSSLPASSRGGKVFRNSSSARYNRKPQGRGAYINPEKFINKAIVPEEQEVFVPQHKFHDFRLSEALQRNVAAHGYVTPTPIQDVSIPPILEGKDFIGLANTGTGKTAAFILPIIEQLQARGGRGAALIIAPTRELAVQINEEFRAFARGLGLYSALCVGGTNMRQQIVALSRRPQVVVGTPGRLKDLTQQKALRLQHTDILVLDEADRMLDMGFIKDINFLVAQLPTQRQTLCFSATITPEIERLLDALLTNPVTASVRTSETSDHVEQDIIQARTKEQKLEILSELLKQPEFEKVLIFGQTKWGVQRLAESLTKLGLPAQAIHGNKTQAQRQRSLQAFKTNASRILVATDVAARGLDIPNVSHVINFDQPGTYDDYIHRIGRTGRAGKSGKALTFVGHH